MKQRLTEISVSQSGKMAAIVYIPIGIVTSIATIVAGVSRDPDSSSVIIFMAILMIFLYPAIGFSTGMILAFVYNLAAKWFGGLEFTLISEPFPTLGKFRPPWAQNMDEEIRKLAKLKEDGVLTEEEFSQKKKALLGIQ